VGPHLRSACPHIEGYRRCKNCGKETHFGKDCPTLARAATRPPIKLPASISGGTEATGSSDGQSVRHDMDGGNRLR